MILAAKTVGIELSQLRISKGSLPYVLRGYFVTQFVIASTAVPHLRIGIIINHQPSTLVKPGATTTTNTQHYTSNSAPVMDADKDNPNPTIVNASDLPSRIPSNPTTKRPTLFDSLITPAYPSYAAPLNDLSSPEGSDVASDDEDDAPREEIDSQEIYDLIASIQDPEHPNSLASLAVVNLPDIFITTPSSPTSRISTVTVLLTPTTAHCSLGTVIGLAVRVRLENALPPRFRIDVRLKEGTHTTADAVNKQLGDKERVAAAMENGTLVGVIRNMLSTCE
jgi:metal-sulfur cluster biosynthetic enzyme